MGHNNKKTFIYGIILVLTFALYGNTIGHEYAFDDKVVISENQYTTKGLGGITDILTHDTFKGYYADEDIVVGGRYRPLSLVTFAVEYELFADNPYFSHFINVLLYTLTAMLIYVILSRLLVRYPYKKWVFSIPFIATVLFIAHPLHTEAVANIKGRDEIMTFLGSLLALKFILDYLDGKSPKYLLYSAIAFFLALMSKENAITFIAVIPLSVYFFTDHSLKKNLSIFIPLLLPAVLFLLIRQAVIGGFIMENYPELMNDPFLYATRSQKYATIFYTLGLYIKLLFFPHPLTYDYYPYHIPIVGWADPRAIIPFVIYLVLFVYALVGLKKKGVIAYGIWFYLIPLTIVSNLFFPIGTFMSERFVYMSSLGFCLIIAYLLSQKLPQYIKSDKASSTVISLILVVVLSLYSFKTISRNEAWKDHFTLVTTDVITSSDSAKSQVDAASAIIKQAMNSNFTGKQKAYLGEAIRHLMRALEIHPRFVTALDLLGNAHVDYDHDYDKAIMYLEKSVEIDPNLVHNLNLLGTLYYKVKKDPRKAIYYLEKVAALNPNDPEIYNNLAVAYKDLKDDAKSKEYIDKAKSLGGK